MSKEQFTLISQIVSETDSDLSQDEYFSDSILESTA